MEKHDSSLQRTRLRCSRVQWRRLYTTSSNVLMYCLDPESDPFFHTCCRNSLNAQVLVFIHLWPWKWLKHLISIIWMSEWIHLAMQCTWYGTCSEKIQYPADEVTSKQARLSTIFLTLIIWCRTTSCFQSNRFVCREVMWQNADDDRENLHSWRLFCVSLLFGRWLLLSTLSLTWNTVKWIDLTVSHCKLLWRTLCWIYYMVHTASWVIWEHVDEWLYI